MPRPVLRLALLTLGLLFALASAAPPQQQQPPPQQGYAQPQGGGGYAPGSCEGACAHYFQCKGQNDPSLVQACAQECYKGGVDAQTLAQFQQADCATAVAMIDGNGQGAPAGQGGGQGQGQWQGGQGQGQGQGAPPAPSGFTCPPANDNADPQMFALLTGNAWCTFTYKGGVTHKSRSVLAADGRGVRASDSESSHSGSTTGSASTTDWGVASQSAGGQRFCWKLSGTTFQLSADGRAYQPSPFTVTYNSNGAPILKGGGEEYMRCQ